VHRWISHRGIRESCDENTMQSFNLAQLRGFKHLETDLRATKDGRIILHHNAEVRPSNGKAFVIRGADIDTVGRCRLQLGGVIPLWEEFADAFFELDWTLDIKRETGAEVIHLLHEWSKIRPSNLDQLISRTRFLLWDEAHDKLLHSLFHGAKCYARKEQCIRAGIAVIAGIPALAAIDSNLIYSVPPTFIGINGFKHKYIKAFHDRGAKVVAYLPDTKLLCQKAIDCGFDEILSDGIIF